MWSLYQGEQKVFKKNKQFNDNIMICTCVKEDVQKMGGGICSAVPGSKVHVHGKETSLSHDGKVIKRHVTSKRQYLTISLSFPARNHPFLPSSLKSDFSTLLGARDVVFVSANAFCTWTSLKGCEMILFCLK